MADCHHGVRVNEGNRPIRTVSAAVIGLVPTAEDPDAANFPLDKPVLVTDVYAAIGKAGASGTLKRFLNPIADQAKPLIVVVRVAEGTDVGETVTLSAVAWALGMRRGDGQLVPYRADLYQDPGRGLQEGAP